MSLPHHQQRVLRRMRRTIRASDPHLWSMLVIFGKLTAREQMPAREQTPGRLAVAVRALASLVSAAVCLAGRLLLAGGRAGLQAADRGLVACRFLPAGLRVAGRAWLAGWRRAQPIYPTQTGEKRR